MNALHAWDAKTDTGAVRPHNEDCFMVDPDRGLFVVCDGMGGHARGEVASSTACATIRDRVAAQPPSRHLGVARDLLVEAIHEANHRVFHLGSGERRPGTTVAAILWARGRFVVAHVGDSRVYRLRRGALVQLTRDHSLANGRIYAAAEALALAGSPIDIVSIASHLRDRERLAQIGGSSYLAQLADATPAVAHVGTHARTVHEKWRLRTLIATCQRVAAEGYGDVGEVQAFIDGAEQGIYALARTEQTTTVQPVRDALRAAFAQITEAAERGGRITGIPTGYEQLDAKTAGLHAGDLMILAARPGMGKTSFALNLGVNVAGPRMGEPRPGEPQDERAEEPGFGVCVFSLEMPREQVAVRMVCSEGRVDVGKVRRGMLSADDWQKLTEAARYLSSLPIWIDDTSALGVLELRAKVRRIQAEYNRDEVKADPARGIKAQAERRVGLVIVDYLQLMKGREGVSSREQEISEISRGLKQLAKELMVPVIALSQLNRAVETRTTKDRRPQLSDLRESGAIEQDSDTILFIYRDEYYNPETSNAKGIAEILIGKQRNGPTGKILTRFTASCTRFDNLAASDYPELEDEEGGRS